MCMEIILPIHPKHCPNPYRDQKDATSRLGMSIYYMATSLNRIPEVTRLPSFPGSCLGARILLVWLPPPCTESREKIAGTFESTDAVQ